MGSHEYYSDRDHQQDYSYNYNQYYDNYYHNYYENCNNYDYSYNYYNYNYYDYQQHQQHQPQPLQQAEAQVQALLVPRSTSGEQQALANSTILQQIFAYSSISDLKGKRLVCKQWNHEVYKTLQEKLCIHFSSHATIKRYMERMDKKRDFAESFQFGPNITLDALIVRQFFTVFGVHIRSLQLQCDSLPISSLEDILFQSLPNLENLCLPSNIYAEDNFPMNPLNLPKLKSLNFLRVKSNGDTDFSDFQSLLKAILHSAPNLETIGASGTNLVIGEQRTNSVEISDLTFPSISKLWDQPPPLDAQLWSAILKEQTFCSKLSNINLNVTLTRNCVQILSCKNLPLMSLDLRINPEISNKLLHQLLNSTLRETLIQIKLQYCGERLEFETDLPITDALHKVRRVHLEGYQGSLAFVAKFPHLTELTFKKINLNKVVLKDAECPLKKEGINLTLKTLKIHQDSSNNSGSNRQRSVQTVQKLGMQFPSVKNLRLERLVDESLCLIYAQWPNLEELEIVHGSFTDAGTTAIHPNAYKVILREEAYDNFNVEALRQGLFLGNLSKLTSLKISSSSITDISVVLGILMCPNIRTVTIQSHQIRDTSLYRLLNKPTIMNITCKNCSKLSTQAITYVSKELKQRGGTSSLNLHPFNRPLDVFKIMRFLGKNPKPKVLLKRLSAREIIDAPKLLKLKRATAMLPIQRRRGRPPMKSKLQGHQSPMPILAAPQVAKRRGRPPVKRQLQETQAMFVQNVIIPTSVSEISKCPTSSDSHQDQKKPTNTNSNIAALIRRRKLKMEEKEVQELPKVQNVRNETVLFLETEFSQVQSHNEEPENFSFITPQEGVSEMSEGQIITMEDAIIATNSLPQMSPLSCDDKKDEDIEKFSNSDSPIVERKCDTPSIKELPEVQIPPEEDDIASKLDPELPQLSPEIFNVEIPSDPTNFDSPSSHVHEMQAVQESEVEVTPKDEEVAAKLESELPHSPENQEHEEKSIKSAAAMDMANFDQEEISQNPIKPEDNVNIPVELELSESASDGVNDQKIQETDKKSEETETVENSPSTPGTTNSENVPQVQVLFKDDVVVVANVELPQPPQLSETQKLEETDKVSSSSPATKERKQKRPTRRGRYTVPEMEMPKLEKIQELAEINARPELLQQHSDDHKSEDNEKSTKSESPKGQKKRKHESQAWPELKIILKKAVIPKKNPQSPAASQCDNEEETDNPACNFVPVEVSLSAKRPRSTRNCTSIFRRFKDYALF